VEKTSYNDGEYKLYCSNSQAALPALFQRMRESGVQLRDLKLNDPTLEDVFLNLTGHELRD
jgi:hypothetical protein